MTMNFINELIESKKDIYTVCMLFFCLRRQNSKYSLFDSSWIKENFQDLLGVPKYMPIKKLETHTDGVNPTNVLVNNGIGYSAVKRTDWTNGKIIVWNCSDNSVITTLDKHDTIVISLALHDGKLYSGSFDNTIKVWNCDDNSLITTLKEHSHVILCMTINDGKLYSGSLGNIKVWDCKSYKLIASVNYGNIAINYMTVSNGKLCFGCGCITVVDLKDYSVITKILVKNKSLTFHNDMIFYGTQNGYICVISCKDYSIIKNYKVHSDCISYLTVHNNMLYTCSDDKTICVWSIKDECIVKRLIKHDREVSYLTIDNGKLYSSDILGNVISWKL